MRNFLPGVGADNYTITFPQHPCVILNALEILGFCVVSSTQKQALNDNQGTCNKDTAAHNWHSKDTIIWTLRKDFDL